VGKRSSCRTAELGREIRAPWQRTPTLTREQEEREGEGSCNLREEDRAQEELTGEGPQHQHSIQQWGGVGSEKGLPTEEKKRQRIEFKERVASGV